MINLGNGHDLAIEFDDRRARLIIYKNGVENVCRTESISKLRKFIQSDQARLFKGRLQLCKLDEGIGIVVKGELAGMLDKDAFTGLLKIV